MRPRLLPYGPGGWLVELDEHDVIGYAAAARAIAHQGVAEVVPGARTVLVRVAEPGALGEIGVILAELAPEPVTEAAARLVEIPVTYEGEDLDAVAGADRPVAPGGRRAPREADVHVRLLRVRARLRVPRRTRPGPPPASARDAAHEGARRIGRHRRRVLRGVPVGVAGRLARDWSLDAGPVGPTARTRRRWWSPGPRCGSCRSGDDRARRRVGRLGDDRPGRRTPRSRGHRGIAERQRRRPVTRAAQPTARQPARRCGARDARRAAGPGDGPDGRGDLDRVRAQGAGGG